MVIIRRVLLENTQTPLQTGTRLLLESHFLSPLIPSSLHRHLSFAMEKSSRPIGNTQHSTTQSWSRRQPMQRVEQGSGEKHTQASINWDGISKPYRPPTLVCSPKLLQVFQGKPPSSARAKPRESQRVSCKSSTSTHWTRLAPVGLLARLDTYRACYCSQRGRRTSPEEPPWSLSGALGSVSPSPALWDSSAEGAAYSSYYR